MTTTGNVRKWVVTIFCAISLFFTYGAALNLNLLVEHIRESLDLSYGKVSVVVSAGFGLVQLLGPFAAVTMEWIGARQSVVISGIVTSLSLAAVSFIQSYALLVLMLGVVYGISQSITAVACITAPGKLFGQSHRQLAVSIPFFGVALSYTVFPLMYNFLNHQFTWRGTMLIMSALSLHVVPTGLLLSSETRKSASLKERLYFKNWNDYRMMAYMAASFFMQFSGLGIGTFFYSILVTEYKLSDNQASLILTIFGVCQIIGRIFSSFAKPWSRYPRWLQWCTASLVSFCAATSLGFGSSFTTALALLSIIGLMIGILIPLRVVAICDLFDPEELTKIYGYSNFALGLGVILGPIASGTLRDLTGNYTLPCAILGGLGCIVFGFGVIAFAARECLHFFRPSSAAAKAVEAEDAYR